MSATGQAIDAYLKSKGSPMAGLGSVFVAAGKKYGVDPRLLVGISGAESSFGKNLFGAYNAWGWGPGRPFASWQEGISTVARGIKTGYIDEGLVTPALMSKKWAPVHAANDPNGLNENWTNNVSTFMREQGASPSTAPSVEVAKPAVVEGSIAAPPKTSDISALLDQFSQPAMQGVQSALFQNLGDISRFGHPTSSSLSNVLEGRMQDLQTDTLNKQRVGDLQDALKTATPAAPPSAPAVSTPSTPPPLAPGNEDLHKWVTLSPNADRKGMPTQTGVLQFVARVAQAFGQPLTIGTGSNHNQYVVGTNRESAHWVGRAADIPADGVELKRLGYLALLAAGMPEDQARQAQKTGGLFNVGGYQIIFDSMIGGNHYNHLHVGLRG